MRAGSDRRLRFSATDLANFVACQRLTLLERDAVLNGTPRPERDSPMADLLARLGDGHERRYLELQRSGDGVVVEIPVGSQDEESLRAAEMRTLQAMRGGADVIYQATFFDGKWGGRADFLVKVQQPSQLGAWSYEVLDTKLSRRTKPAAILQLCEYSLQVGRLQGHLPDQMHIVLGDGRRESISLHEVTAYYRHLRGRFDEVVSSDRQPPYPEPVNHCQLCRWNAQCEEIRREDDHLSLVARISRGQVKKLNTAALKTVVELANAPSNTQVSHLSPLTFERLRDQAKLQVKARAEDQLLYEMLEPIVGRGLSLLPTPSASDLFFDIEADPLFEDGGLEYLFGVRTAVGERTEYRSWRANNRSEEKLAFEAFIDFVIVRLDADPAMHVYHYADYEKAAMKRLMARHGTREMEVDRLLRGEVFVDLYAVVRGAVRLGAESYSLKTVEHLYLPARTDTVQDGAASIIEYERWRMTGDGAILDEIEKYNAVDCVSTQLLRGWLEQRRTELVAAGANVPRPDVEESAPSEQALQNAAANEQRARGLLDPVRDIGLDSSQRWLLAEMLDWHQREDRPQWWDYFYRLSLSDEELIDDTAAIGGLRFVGVIDRSSSSVLHEFAFPTGQEHKLSVGTAVRDPRTQRRCGTVAAIDDRIGKLVTKSRYELEDPPQALVPDTHANTKVLRDAIARMVDWILEAPKDERGAFESGVALLQRRPPGSGAVRREGESVEAAALRVARELRAGVFPIQGPPGSGKTFLGARLIFDLVRQGRKVGIAGPSHRAISNLVQEVCKASKESGRRVRIVQKTELEQEVDDCVQLVAKNEEVEEAMGEVDVVAGTPWLFARRTMLQQFDVLVVDEAGQVPLANALAICGAAPVMILLGDPQQLPQPAVGAHPAGASPSTLEHLLAGHPTISADLGLFLDLTWRMHPSITSVVSELSYEGRLESQSECALQEVSGSDALSGAGVRFLSVEHSGNRVASSEEAQAVADLVEDLCTRQWRSRDGEWRDITLDDILIVAPFNAHVARLSGVLPEGARIGTVDKFQGQEAAVTIFSMGTSSADDAPRGLEFIFNLNRLNVAISRGRALSVLVASPRLLDAECRNAAQVRLVNALCRLVEVATPVQVRPPLVAAG